MIIREIKVGELPGFVDSELFKSVSPKPITRVRAISQFHNPRAHPDDTALIIACEDNVLLAMVGLLPDFISGNPDFYASSNSGWWAHPERGRSMALPLFARAMKCCRQRMFLTDCTAHSREILEKTGWFEFMEPILGLKIIFRFYFQQMAERRYGTGLVAKTARVADHILNSLLFPFLNREKGKNPYMDVNVTITAAIDDQVSRFILSHNREEFTGRTAIDITWALNWKWLQTDGENEVVNYPFSATAKSFKQVILVFARNNATIGLAIVNIREAQATIPYFYAESGEEQSVWGTLFREITKLQIISLICFNPEYVRFLNKHQLPGLFIKQVFRHVAVSKELFSLFQKYPVIQDGDGDCIFT